MKWILMIAVIFLIGCESYSDRFSQHEYKDNNKIYYYSEEIHYPINGIRQKVKQLDYDKYNVLRKETFYRNKTIHKIKLYDNTGDLIREEAFNSKTSNAGYRINYYSGGNKKEEYEFLDSKKNGPYNSYYQNGMLQSNLEYLQDELMGSCSWYYPNGNIYQIKEFIDNSNYQLEFHENGRKRSEGFIEFDKPVGRWIFYDQNESILKEEDY